MQIESRRWQYGALFFVLYSLMCLGTKLTPVILADVDSQDFYRALISIGIVELQILMIWFALFLLALMFRQQLYGLFRRSPGLLPWTWGMWGGLFFATLVVLNAIDAGYFSWSHHKLDLVFFHNLGWPSMVHVYRTLSELYSPILIFVATLALVLLPFFCVYLFHRLTLAMLRHMDVILATSSKRAAACVLLVIIGVDLALSKAQAAQNETLLKESVVTQQLAEHPANALWEELSRRRAIFSVMVDDHNLESDIVKLRQYFSSQFGHQFVGDKGSELPFARQHIAPCQANNSCAHMLNTERPLNLVFIVTESLSGVAVAKHPDRVPNLLKLSQHGIYFDQFFANSLQTANGLVVSLCSAYPNHGERFTRTGLADKLNCMSDILKSKGYLTGFMTGSSIVFDNMKEFIGHHSYDQVFSWENESNNQASGSWGLHDGALFDRVLSTVQAMPAKTPFFLTALTVSMHPPFDINGNESEKLGLQERYLRALSYFDAELGKMLESFKALPQYKDTVFVVTGDHAIDWEGNMLDLFHAPIRKTTMAVPLFIFGEPVLPKSPSGDIVHKVGSQIDIAPTILSQMGIDKVNGLWGNDLFDPRYSGYAIYFNHYQNNFVGYVKDTLLYRMELPRWIETQDVDTEQTVQVADHDAVLELSGRMFKVYNNLLLRYKIWDNG